MNKNFKIAVIIVLVIIMVILLFPTKVFVSDGGSYGYQAILYDITFWRGTEGESALAKYGDTSVRILFFEFYFAAK